MSGDRTDPPEAGDGPVQRARAHARRDLPKRFFKSVDVNAGDDGFRIALDGRPVRSPGGLYLQVPTRSLGEQLAGEWRAQTEFIDPAAMPLTRLVNSAMDAVSREPGRVRADIVDFAGSDMLLYRAEGPEQLVERQNAAWDPVVAWAQSRLGGRLVLAGGIVHVEQDPETLDALDRLLLPLDALALTALHVVTTLTGSALLALALSEGYLTAAAAWDLAHLDEDWNMEHWGRDEEALARRAARHDDYRAAVAVLAASDTKIGER